MSVVFMTGSHPRHAYLARCIAESGLLVGVVVEQREEHVPQPPEGLQESTRELFVRHFAGREKSEAAFFTDGSLPAASRSSRSSGRS